MDKREDIITGAAAIFESEGFRGVGVDGILAPSGVSTRTLYKHFGSRDGLVLAVLARRHGDFMARLRAPGTEAMDAEDPIAHLFDTLAQWMLEHGARGCMLLRARSEYAGANPQIVALVRQQKAEFLTEIGRRVQMVLARQDEALALQIWLLFEGATAAASVAQASTIAAAKAAAGILVQSARGAP